MKLKNKNLLIKELKKLKVLLGGLIGGTKNETSTDSTSTQTDSTKTTNPIENGVKGILENILGGKKKKKDSTKNK